MSHPDCLNCDKHCADHNVNTMLVEMHEKRLTTAENVLLELSGDITNLEGRFTIFLWVVGLLFIALVGLSGYGARESIKLRREYVVEIAAVKSCIAQNEKYIAVNSTKLSGARR